MKTLLLYKSVHKIYRLSQMLTFFFFFFFWFEWSMHVRGKESVIRFYHLNIFIFLTYCIIIIYVDYIVNKYLQIIIVSKVCCTPC